jgi:pimeloyl-ACP methyl ester carboxylesterase
MKEPSISHWKDENLRARFDGLLQAIWDDHHYPAPESLDVPTWAGSTRVYRWRGQGEPIVLLHGMGGNGLMWGPYLEGLAGHDVYAIDTVGDIGRSQQTSLIADGDDLARWLDDTLAAAGIEGAHLAGTSYGGYLALNLAARIPGRVRSIVLIDAGGLSPFRLARFMLWGMPNLLGSKAPEPIRRALARTRPLLEDPRVMKLALLGQMGHVYGLPQPAELTDDQLRSIAVPATVIVAGRSAPFSPKLAASRAALIPGALIDTIDEARHEIIWTHVDECLAHLLRHCSSPRL